MDLDLNKIEYLRRASRLSHSEILKFQEIMNSHEFSIKKLARHFSIEVSMAQWLLEEMDK